MEYLNSFYDLGRLVRAAWKEGNGGPAAALAMLQGDPKSRRWRVIWKTFSARLRVISREGEASAELLPLKDHDWFRSPGSELEIYSRSYVLYLQACLTGDEDVANLHVLKMEALSVTPLVRRLLIIT